ncbi:MAG TPA: amino acid--[acyl-carrier-protein] ligase [Burkholderiales bacterium]|nr:amino acid--[acyl-carrier-protein] ligase [Burkholderiales bacterium]
MADYRDELVAAGLLIPTGVRGVYGLGGTFEGLIERLDAFVTRSGAPFAPEVIRFPPVVSRANYLRTDHLESFPDLMGSVHSFMGDDKAHLDLVRRKQAGEDWACCLAPTDVMLAPAACYPLYPTATGVLPAAGRTVDLRSFVFRHEPSEDPARMQLFRMHEFVRLGTPEQALRHRDDWLDRGEAMLRSLGLDPVRVVANDPFFGRGGRVMVATQREQALKFELVVPIASAAKPTAVASSNYHLDHFGVAFDIRTPDGAVAHSACVGFGLERIALALFRRHGFDPETWPAAVRAVLDPA